MACITLLNSTFKSLIIVIISLNCVFVFSQTLLRDLFICSLRLLNILIIVI